MYDSDDKKRGTYIQVAWYGNHEVKETPDEIFKQFYSDPDGLMELTTMDDKPFLIHGRHFCMASPWWLND